MDFSLSAEQREFRNALCALLDRPEMRAEIAALNDSAGGEQHAGEIYRALGRRGWLAANMPKAYGGGGLSLIEAAMVTEELCSRGIVDTLHVVTIDFVGMFLLLAGTPEQKLRYLPAMAAGDSYSCVLHSEAAAGSDLTQIATRAIPEPGGFALSGTKLYSLRAEQCDYALCSARLVSADGGTPTGSQGLTLFMVPLNTPGISIESIPSLADEQFGRVVLNGVHVDHDSVIGPLGDGWRLLNAALSIERTGLEQSAKCRHWLDVLLARARETGHLNDPWHAATLARLDADVEAGRLLAWHTVTELAAGRLDTIGAAMSKYYNSEIARRIAEVARKCWGADALLARSRSEPGTDGFFEWLHREAPGMTISAGTAEIMLYVVAGAEVTNS